MAGVPPPFRDDLPVILTERGAEAERKRRLFQARVTEKARDLFPIPTTIQVDATIQWSLMVGATESRLSSLRAPALPPMQPALALSPRPASSEHKQ